jgi:hypothetical protein
VSGLAVEVADTDAISNAANDELWTGSGGVSLRQVTI